MGKGKPLSQLVSVHIQTQKPTDGPNPAAYRSQQVSEQEEDMNVERRIVGRS